MNARPRDYKVSRDSETARLLKEAAASPEPIRVDTGEVVYRVDLKRPQSRTTRNG